MEDRYDFAIGSGRSLFVDCAVIVEKGPAYKLLR
jgi:hypothetical protein